MISRGLPGAEVGVDETLLTNHFDRYFKFIFSTTEKDAVVLGAPKLTYAPTVIRNKFNGNFNLILFS